MHAYLLFHSLVEIVSATISLGTFVFAWNTRRHQDSYLLTLGMGAAFVGAFEALHCLAFPGMSVFPGYDANLSPQLWLSARLLQAGAGLVGLVLLGRRVGHRALLGGFLLAFSVLAFAVFSGSVPAAVRQGGGLTTFKVAAEWTLAATFGLIVALLFRERRRFSPRVFRYLVANGVTMAACEVCFTLYVSPEDFANLLGHLLLLAGGSFQFAAVVRAGLKDPGETYLRDLAQAEERLRLFVDHAPAALAMFDRHMRYVSASRRWMADYGLGDTDLRGRSHYEVFPEIGDEWKAVHRRGLAGEVVVADADQFVRADGTVQWLRWEVRPWHEPDGAVGGIVVFSEDITEQKLAEEALRRHEEGEQERRREAERHAAELDAILDSLSEPLLVTDARGGLVRANPAFRELMGAPPDWKDLAVPERLRRARIETPEGQPVDPATVPGVRALAGETVHGVLQRVPKPGGGFVYLETSAAPIRTGAGVVGAVVVFHDVSDRTQAERVLRDADREKSEFLALLSHELRNPLAAISTGLHVLGHSTAGPDAVRRVQDVIRRQVGQLVRLVDDLLDVTRLSRHKIRLQLEHVELNDLVGRVVEDHRVLFDAAGLRLEFERSPRALVVRADPNRMAQVVGNLLQNAAKFTPPGGHVSVRASAPPVAAAAEIEVVDDGAGLAADVLARVFQPFVQAHATLDRSKGGLGLGLWLVKGLTELHGGEALAYSDGPGKGARFVVRLPLAASGAATAPAPRPEPAPRRESVHVLVIEDNADAADSLREALRLEGHLVTVTLSGAEGLARAREVRPDVVLCDIGLPGMDGYDVARAFRADADLGAIPLVALSGYALAEDRERARAAGFDRHLAKPADVEAIQGVLAELVGRST